MVKKLLLYLGLVIVLFYTTYLPHNYFSDYYNVLYNFSLKDVYLFHAISSLVLCFVFELIYHLSESFRDQLGFLYLGSTVLKVMLFFIVFSSTFLSSDSLSNGEGISLLIPMAIFIFFEVIIVIKILNRTV